MDNLKSLKNYFKGGSAEAEKDIRGSVFISPKDIDDILSFQFEDSLILLGNKGTGKSILVNVLHEAYLKNNELSLLIKPNDLKCDEILSKKTLADKRSTAYIQILIAIANQLGNFANKNDNFTIKSDIAALQQFACENGSATPDFIQKFSSFLVKILPKGKEIAENILQLQSTKIDLENNLTDIVGNYLDDKNMNLWLLIDDIDEAGAPLPSQNGFDYSACWGIISAARELTNDINRLKCIISVRSDIWHLMTAVKRHGSSELDKITNLYELKFSEDELAQILKKRIELAILTLNKKDNTTYSTDKINLFFNEKLILPGNKGETRDWIQWISKQSRFRPRDLVQLVQFLLRQTKKNSSSLISSKEAHDIMLEFAKSRIDNIKSEYMQICPQIHEIIDDFSEEKDIYSFIEVINLIEKIPSKRSTEIDGIKVNSPPTKEHKMQILRLLHMACFLNPREESYESDDYTHLNYIDYPDLINVDNYNKLQKYKWQIHPTFHSYTATKRPFRR